MIDSSSQRAGKGGDFSDFVLIAGLCDYVCRRRPRGVHHPRFKAGAGAEDLAFGEGGHVIWQRRRRRAGEVERAENGCQRREAEEGAEGVVLVACHRCWKGGELEVAGGGLEAAAGAGECCLVAIVRETWRCASAGEIPRAVAGSERCRVEEGAQGIVDMTYYG